MLTTPHAVTGAALGALITDPALAIPAAIASHYLLDMVPHWQETLAPYTPTRATWIRIPLDLALTVGLVTTMCLWLPDRTGVIVAGAIAGNLPDADVALILFPQFKRGLIKRHWDFHSRIQRETASWWGLTPQLAVIGAAVATVYALRSK